MFQTLDSRTQAESLPKPLYSMGSWRQSYFYSIGNINRKFKIAELPWQDLNTLPCTSTLQMCWMPSLHMTNLISSGNLGPQDFLVDLSQFSSNPHTWTRAFSLIPELRLPRRIYPMVFLLCSLGAGTNQRSTQDCSGNVRLQVMILLAFDCAHVWTSQDFNLDVWSGMAALANIWQSPAVAGFLFLFS